MQRHVFSFEVEATREEVWAALHPPPPANPTGDHRVLEYGGVRIEIVHEGDVKGEGLVRTCTFRVPKLLLSGGVGRSWECVHEVRPPEFSRYGSVGKPLWSEAAGWHRLEDLGCGRTRGELSAPPRPEAGLESPAGDLPRLQPGHAAPSGALRPPVHLTGQRPAGPGRGRRGRRPTAAEAVERRRPDRGSRLRPRVTPDSTTSCSTTSENVLTDRSHGTRL